VIAPDGVEWQVGPQVGATSAWIELEARGKIAAGLAIVQGLAGAELS
jgi:hypothetical protein